MAHNERGEQYIAFDGAPLGKETFIFNGDPIAPRTVGAAGLHFNALIEADSLGAGGPDAGMIRSRLVDFVEVTAVNPDLREVAYAELYARIQDSQRRGEITLPALAGIALDNLDARIEPFITASLAKIPSEIAERAKDDSTAFLREAVDTLSAVNKDLAIANAEATAAFEVAYTENLHMRSDLLQLELLLAKETPDIEAMRAVLHKDDAKKPAATGPIPYVPGHNTNEVAAQIIKKAELTESSLPVDVPQAS